MSEQCKHYVFVTPFNKCVACENDKRDEIIQTLITLNIELIETLENSCIEHERGEGHEFSLFDNVDKGRLCTLKEQLTELKK